MKIELEYEPLDGDRPFSATVKDMTDPRYGGPFHVHASTLIGAMRALDELLREYDSYQRYQ